MSGPGDDELRRMVRELLREVLPALAADRAAATPEPAPASKPETPASRATEQPGGAEVVALRTDADLDRFVRRLLALFENPKQRDDLRAGRLRFTLAGSGRADRAGPSRRVDRGAVTERLVNEAAREGATLRLGRRAVLTPLARDRARALGVVVERES